MVIRSRAYLAGARGENCKLRVAGVCCDERDTVVPCHVRDRHTGRSIKASDLSVIDGCWRCHEVFDGRAKMPDGQLMSNADWNFYALRGLQETIERRIEQAILSVPQDKPKVAASKPRKPKEQRAKIQSAGFPNPKLAPRKLQSRNNLRRTP